MREDYLGAGRRRLIHLSTAIHKRKRTKKKTGYYDDSLVSLRSGKYHTRADFAYGMIDFSASIITGPACGQGDMLTRYLAWGYLSVLTK